MVYKVIDVSMGEELAAKRFHEGFKFDMALKLFHQLSHVRRHTIIGRSVESGSWRSKSIYRFVPTCR